MNWSEHLYYSEDSPSGLRWTTDRYNGKDHNRKQISKGDVAGTQNGIGYWVVSVLDVKAYCHIIIWELFNGKTTLDVDHEDRDKSNNRIGNLRAVTHAVNMRNQNRVRHGDVILGVCKHTINRKDGSIDTYWRARWKELDGTGCGQLFNTKKYGEEGAMNKAIETRKAAISRLNSLGAGYSEIHQGLGQ